MKKQLGDRLPDFTPEEVALVKGSNDFYGMNTYTANYIKHLETPVTPDDHHGNVDLLMQNKAGEWIGPEAGTGWLRPHPLGFRKLLNWISDRYGKPQIYVTENGVCIKDENDLPLEQLLNDEFRCKYYTDYINQLALAVNEDGVNIKSYMAWSLME